ncbi:hypothetical protein AGMMS49957_01680 [Synergistales bacterium]|nr:hypothetical protein AGMMS49957_01680 [Synergistales bacterium]
MKQENEDFEDFKTTPEKAEDILNKEKPLRRMENRAYSRLMHSLFEKIESLHSKGFCFTQICNAFEKSGILPEHSNPYCFRQAFYRERIRRAKEEELMCALEDESNDESKDERTTSGKEAIRVSDMAKAKTISQTSVTQTPTIIALKAAKVLITQDDDEDAARKARVRRLTDTRMNTGLGIITKHSDGSFDFD